ncbi:MAG: glutathione ABC transporter substrate-binding protein [Bacillota bacterium]
MGNRRVRGLLLALAVVFLVVAVVAGCAPKTPAPAPTTPAQPPAPPPPPKPKVLTIASGTDIERLDPHLSTASPTFSVLSHIFETLFFMSPTGEVKPELAETFKVEPEGNVYTITLRKGVKFSDGTPFDSHAVKVNLERVLNVENKAAYRSLINTVTDIRIIDSHTIQLVTERPFGPMLSHLSHSGLAIISPKALAEGPDYLARNPVGTGPFVLKEWKQGESVTLAKRADYWRTPAALDEVVFKVVKEDGARLIEVESGTSDIAVRVPPSEVERLQKNPNLVIDRTVGLRTIYVYFNVTKPPFDDVRVRQAFNYAVDKDAIVNHLLLGAARVSDAPIAPAVFGYAQQTAYKRNVEKAKALLQEAGYGSGLKVTFHHPTGRYVQDARIADAIRAQLAEVGVTLELVTMEWPLYLEAIRKPLAENQVSMALLGWGCVTMDADYALYDLFHSAQWAPSFNLGFYKNERVDRLLHDARNTADTTKRLAYYREAQQLLWADAPWLFLHSEVQLTALRKDVKGFMVHPTERLMAHSADK